MTQREAGGLVLLILAFAAASWIGWWMAPATAFVWGALRPARRWPAATAALAAGLAAVAWLGANVVTGGRSIAILTGRLAELLSLPALALVAATVLIPVLLAWSGAAAGSAIRRLAPSPTQPNP